MASQRGRSYQVSRARILWCTAAVCAAAMWLPGWGAATAAEPLKSAKGARTAGVDTAAKQARSADAQPESPWEARVHAALRRESSTSGAEQEQAIRELATLYGEIKQAKGLGKEQRQELSGLVRNRLSRVSDRISRRLAKAHVKSTLVKASVATSSPGYASAAPPQAPVRGDAGPLASGVKRVRAAEPLAQQLAGGAAAGQQPDLLGALAELIEHVIAPNQWDPVLAQQVAAPPPLVGGGAFGGGAFGGGGAPGGRGPADHGQELVELIQHTIAPDTWDINGGNGTIVYFQPLHAIVVRQTGEVHENLGGLLKQARD